MYESASLGLRDTEVTLRKIGPADLSFPAAASPEVLRAVLRINAFCTVNGDKFSPMKLLYQSDWIDLDKITEVNENAIKMVYRIADRWVKECAADKNEALDGVKDVFAYINVYRQYKKLPPMKQSKVGVNEQCPCKSGKKYKKCHFEFQQKYLQY